MTTNTTQSNLQEAVRTFMGACDQHVNEFNARQITLYTGLQLEEMAEKLEAIEGGTLSADHTWRDLTHAIGVVRALSAKFKGGMYMGNVLRCIRKDLLDADIDLAWVSLGAAYSTSCDTEGAIAEVARANLDKVPGGVCTRDENGKVMKPEGWRAPDLSPFVADPID